MVHFTEIQGESIEGNWYVCVCGEEGTLFESMGDEGNLAAAQAEADIHMSVNAGEGLA